MENPGAEPAGFGFTSRRPKNLSARIYHCLVAVAFFILLLLALSALGTTAVTYNDIRENSVYGKPVSKGGYDGRGGTCILYVDFPCTFTPPGGVKVKNDICLSDDPACQFAVTGSGLVALVAVLLMVFSLVKAGFGFRAFSLLVLIDLLLVVPAFVIGLASSGVISGGLAATCDSLSDLSKSEGGDGDAPCCSYAISKDQDHTERIYFYEALDTAQVVSWTATILLFIVMVMDIIVLIVYAVRRSMRSSMAGYVPQEDLPSSPPAYEDDELPDVAAEYKQ